MATSRRNVLAILGLAGAGTAALSAENVTAELGADVQYQSSRVVHIERLATAFERMAAALRSGEISPEEEMTISSRVGVDDWLRQELKFSFSIAPEGRFHKPQSGVS